jgi:hypothetical protein
MPGTVLLEEPGRLRNALAVPVVEARVALARMVEPLIIVRAAQAVLTTLVAQAALLARQMAVPVALGQTAQVAVAAVAISAVQRLALVALVALALSTQSPQAARLVQVAVAAAVAALMAQEAPLE